MGAGFHSGEDMQLFDEILDSRCGDSNNHLSWEGFIRHIAGKEGMDSADFADIYPIMGFDVKIMEEPFVVGFAIIPDYQPEIEEFCGLFFDYDDVELFEDFVNYVYQFEDTGTWKTDVEVLLHHNKVAVIHPQLQEIGHEFGFDEAITAAQKGQYEGYSRWVRHPKES